MKNPDLGLPQGPLKLERLSLLNEIYWNVDNLRNLNISPFSKICSALNLTTHENRGREAFYRTVKMKLKQQTNPFGKKENKEQTKQYKTTDDILLNFKFVDHLDACWNPCISLVYETIFLRKLRVSLYTIHHHVFKYLFLSLLFGQKAILQFSLNQCKSWGYSHN